MKRWIKPLFLLSAAFLFAFRYGDEQVKQDTENVLKQSALLAIKGYKSTLSPAGAPPCHFYPSCSLYTKEAIEKHGLKKGLLMGFDRLTRCHKDHDHYPTVWVKDEIKNVDLP